MSSSQYKGKIVPIEKISMANPYKFEEGDSEWQKVCKKYREKDKSKLPKKKKSK